MLALAQAAPKESAKAKSGAKHSAAAAVFETADAAPLQRKTRPCGGGCLRCQAKLDPYEREADQVAEQVLSKGQPEPIGSTPAAIQTKRTPSGVAPAGRNARAAVRETAHGGAPLPKEVRSFFEPRFGHDFGLVRIDTGTEAADAARGVEARAYTYGSSIVFGAGEYAPETGEGKRLLAHELVHVVQQTGGAPMNPVGKDAAENAFAATPYPGDDNLVADPTEHDPECMETASAFRGKKWSAILPEMVREYAEALPLFTPAAFRYYFPSLASLQSRNPVDAAKDNVVFNLTPPAQGSGWEADFFQARAVQFSAVEGDAIASFLELMRQRRLRDWAAAGKEPPASGIERALEFWRLGH